MSPADAGAQLYGNAVYQQNRFLTGPKSWYAVSRMVVWLKRLFIAGISALTVYIVFAYWGYAPDDPRNIRYILWKRGLNGSMNLDTAMSAFYQDTDRDQLIRGTTEDQLKTRFGYVRQLEQVSLYLQRCRNEGREGKTVVFLRDSWWMVVMDNQKGSELVLCKGY